MNQILLGDVLASLKTIESNSVQCVVTSPPYWGLRDYGVSGQLGLETTPQEYVATMARVFDEVRRVLKPDGTLWLNVGDSYAAPSKSRTSAQAILKTGLSGGVATQMQSDNQPNKITGGFKRKELIGIPWRLAFALQDAGWYLRQDIIWAKRNPMPESVTDRCTKAHEYLFLLSKSATYYFDHEAIKEPAACGWNGSEFHTGKTAQHQLGRAQVRPSKKRGEFAGKTENMEG